MDRRFALVALWAVFAAAAVGVGFGAAGLVGDPFGDGVSGEPVSTRSGTATSAGVTPGPSSSGSATPDLSETPDAGGTPDASGSGTATTSRPGPTRSPEPTAVTRSLSTRAGLVSATCRGGVVRVAASPAVGWEIEDLDGGGSRGRVRFERADDGDGRVEVRVSCVDGRPRFTLDDGGEEDDDRRDEPTSDDSPSPDESEDDHSGSGGGDDD